MATDFEEGLLVGILVGEGHFGGDGRQPHVTLRMHERHAPLFRWIGRTVPGGRLYGPYDHGGRRYLQWMARGSFLRDVVVPILDRRLTPDVDAYAFGRYVSMRAQYQRQLGHFAATIPLKGTTGAASTSTEPAGERAAGPDGPAAGGAGHAGPGQVPQPRPSPEIDAAGRIFSALRQADDRS